MLRGWISSGRLPSLRITTVWAAGIVLTLGLGGLLFAASGIYNIAASTGHWAVTRGLLELALRSSVRTHSIGIEAPSLDDPDLLQLGAAHFAGGCAPCHGAPGEPRNAVITSMVPEPPSLSNAIQYWDTEELFWIVRHGIKMTGMPAWASQHREDEVWSVVAFLERLPEMTPEEYRALASHDALSDPIGATEERATFSQALLACGRCHEGRDPPGNRFVPRLVGQSARYLEAALHDYKAGYRFSGIMQPVASELDGKSIARLAAYYSELAAPPTGRSPPATPERVARGRLIAKNGIAEERVPACLACHGPAANALFPRLAGQPAPYLVTQLTLWKNGERGRFTTTNAIMKPIAERLTDRQMRDVAAYFASLPADGIADAEPDSTASAEAGAR